jgi:cytochrome c-type biogenesis protein
MSYEHVSPLTYLAAFGGGVVSFLSPCVLPIVPGYLSVVTGLDLAELREGSRRHLLRITRDTGLFVLGFGTVFILLGLSATTIGAAVFRNQLLLTRLSGALVLAMALFLLGSVYVRAPWLYQEKRFHPTLSRFGPFAPPVAGAAFGFGWTPCIGPVLGSILAVAATQGRAWEGASLLAAYSLGLGLPFLITGLMLSRMAGAFAFVKRHFTGLVFGSAATLAFFGVLLMFNRLVWVTARLQNGLEAVGLDRLVTLG